MLKPLSRNQIGRGNTKEKTKQKGNIVTKQILFINLLCVYFLLFSNCAHLSGSIEGTSVPREKYLKNPTEYKNLIFECNKESISLSPEEVLMLQDFTELLKNTNAYFVVADRSINDTAKHLFRCTFKKDTIINGDKLVERLATPTYFLDTSIANSMNVPDTFPLEASLPKPGIDERGEKVTYIIPFDTIQMDSSKIKAIRLVFAFWNKYKSQLNVNEISSEDNDIITDNRVYSKSDFMSTCDSKNDYQRWFGEWVIFDKEKTFLKKQWDKKEPEPYEVLDDFDSTVFKYRTKSNVVIRKPCNLEDAHNKLIEILNKNGERITAKTDMALYHFGIGMWVRNNWGLWSGKSRLLPYFKKKGITHPDNMSGVILETLKERIEFEVAKKGDLSVYYKKIEDIECNKE